MAKKIRELFDTNRTMKLKPKIGKFWCEKCDMYLARPGQKCPVCGTKQNKRRLKK